jgi:hypothetical protein
MYGARSAMAAGLAHVEEQVRGIERAIVENPGLAFDLAKTLIESTCKTILAERGVAFENGADLPTLFRAAKNCLPMLPASASGDGKARKSLEKTLNGLNTALHGVAELRNAYGFASHGSESPRSAMESTQAMLAAEAADAILGFLHGVHRQQMSIVADRLEFGDNETFNAYIDDANDAVRVFDLEYRPSEVLFSVDLSAYRDHLANYAPDDENSAETVEEAPL